MHKVIKIVVILKPRMTSQEEIYFNKDVRRLMISKLILIRKRTSFILLTFYDEVEIQPHIWPKGNLSEYLNLYCYTIAIIYICIFKYFIKYFVGLLVNITVRCSIKNIKHGDLLIPNTKDYQPDHDLCFMSDISFY